jgi:hypothetical protein
VRSVRSAFYAALVLLCGATAAVVAHVVIDVAGDFVLARDSYDGLAHHSRAFFLGIVVVLAALVALRFLWEALDRRSGSVTALVRYVQAARGASPWRFGILVAAVAIAGLVAMESLDAMLSATRIDGVEDLLGGSVLLGLGTTLAVSALVAGAARALLGFLAAWEPVIAAFVGRLLTCRPASPAMHAPRSVRLTCSLDRACRLARRGGKRAPPMLTPV